MESVVLLSPPSSGWGEQSRRWPWRWGTVMGREVAMCDSPPASTDNDPVLFFHPLVTRDTGATQEPVSVAGLRGGGA